MFDVHEIRKQFPILNRQVNGKPLIYFDNAASTQVPLEVLKGMESYYLDSHANVHRGVHTLSQEATSLFETVRYKMASFIHARYPEEIIFTSGTTEGINLLAQTYGRAFLKKGDEILISTMEHHANIVPWQMLCETQGCTLKVIPITPQGELDLDAYESMLSERTKLVSVVHISNVLGTINPVKKIIERAHKAGAKVLLDAAQSIGHQGLNVQELEVDFLVFSGHKMHGPTGTGVFYARKEWLDLMPPWKGGGDMIATVTFEKTTYNTLPYKFEAGTPNIMGVIGLGYAIDYITKVGYETISSTETSLLTHLIQVLTDIPGVRWFGTSPSKIGIVSFLIDGVHPSDLGTLLDMEGIAVRVGHHCAQPLMQHFNIPGTVRASLAFYNSVEEIQQFGLSLRKVLTML
jgi:cysteine desulfurase/selenocysteine lyase